MEETTREWDQETAKIIAWFERTIPPEKPIQLDQGRTVTGPVKFWESMKSQISAGPDAPRARSGVLQRDLRLVKEALERMGN